MPIEKQIIEVPFAKGLNESVDPSQVSSEQMLAAENIRWEQDASVSKRPGYVSKVLAPVITGGAPDGFLARNGSGILYSNSSDIYTVTDPPDVTTTTPTPIMRDSSGLLITKPAESAFTLETLEYCGAANGAEMIDMDVYGDYVVIALGTYSTTNYRVFVYNRVNNICVWQQVLGTTAGNTYTHLQVRFSTTTGLYTDLSVNVYYNQGANLYLNLFDLDGLLVSRSEPSASASTVVTDLYALGTTVAFDIRRPDNVGQAWYLAYVDTNQDPKIAKLNSVGTSVASSVVVEATTISTYHPSVISCFSDTSSNVTVAYVTTAPAFRMRRYDSSLTAVYGIVTVTSPVGHTANQRRVSVYSNTTHDVCVMTNGTVISSSGSGSGYNVYTAAGALASSIAAIDIYLSGKCFERDSKLYFPGIAARTGTSGEIWTTPFPSHVVVCCGTTANPRLPVISSMVVPRIATSYSNRPCANTVTTITAYSTQGALTANERHTYFPVTQPRVGGNNASNQTDVQCLIADLGHGLHTGSIAQYGPVSVIGSSALMLATPSEYIEAGIAEEANYVAATTVAGGAMTAGTYQVTYCFRRTDCFGNIYRSAFAPAVSASPAAGNLTIRVTKLGSCLSFAQFNYLGSSPLEVEIYCTSVGSTFPFYFVDSVNASTGTYDIVADPTTTNRVALYGTTYAQPGYPPGLSSLVTFNNRVFGIAPDGFTIYFSSVRTENEGIFFSDQYTVQVDSSTRIKSLGVLDDKLVIFCEDSIYYFTGDGPDLTLNGSFSPIQRVTSPVGCQHPSSVVSTQQGVFFANLRGIYLLDRSLQITLLSESVQDLYTQRPYVVGAWQHPRETIVYFSLGTQYNLQTDASTGMLLEYNWKLNAWSSSITDAGSILASSKFSHGVGTPNVLYMLHNGLGLVYESTSTWLDGDGTWSNMVVETGNVNLSGLIGYQRVWFYELLLKQHTPCDIQIEIFTDNDTTPSQTENFTDSDLGSMPTYATLRVRVAKQKCRSMRVRITVQTPTSGSVGTGQAVTLIGQRFICGIRNTLDKRVSANQKKG